MPGKIDYTHRELKFALDNGDRLNVSKKNWYVEGRIEKILNVILRRKESGLVNLSKVLCERFNKLERSIPCRFKNGRLEHRLFFQNWIDTANSLVRRMSRSTNAQTICYRLLLQRKIVSLQSRMTNSEKAPQSIDEDKLEQIKRVAAEWKARQLYMTRVENGPFDSLKNREILKLNEKDINKLRELCAHEDYVDLLLNEDALKKAGRISRRTSLLIEEAFGWMFKYRLPVNVLAEFSGTVNMLDSTYGKTRPDDGSNSINIRYHKSSKNGVTKQVVMPIGPKKRLHDITSKYSLAHFKKGNYTVTTDEIFAHHFAHKNICVGNFEWLGGAIQNFHTKEFGYWDDKNKRIVHIDLDKSEWINNVPYRDVDREELGKMLPDFKDIKDGQNFLLIGASSQHISQAARRNSQDTHTMVGFVEWLPEKKIWGFREFGFYVKHSYPSTPLEFIKFFANTVLGAWSIGDSQYMKGRQFAWHPRTLKDDKPQAGEKPLDGTVQKFLDKLKERIELSRSDNLAFNIQSFSCAHEGHDFFVFVMGDANLSVEEKNVFIVPSTWPEITVAPMSWFITAVKKVPLIFQKYLINGLLFFFAPWRGFYVLENGKLVWKSMWSSDCRKLGYTYHPGKIINDIEDKLLVAR